MHSLYKSNTIQHLTPSTSIHTGNTVPFLYTPTSLLPEHSVLTDGQQATGRNGQQWITCRSEGQGTRPQIWMGNNGLLSNSTANSATIGLGSQLPNGLYHCLSAQSQRQYFSLFLRNSGTNLHYCTNTPISLACKTHWQSVYNLTHNCTCSYSLLYIVTMPSPTASVWDTTVWSFTSPDGSRVERYIVEFECGVRNITFVEKYMSVSASGGTGRVATSVSCFGGLGQLYRVKVWAVSGPNISRALVCIPDGQCREEGGRHTMTCTVSHYSIGNVWSVVIVLSK